MKVVNIKSIDIKQRGRVDSGVDSIYVRVGLNGGGDEKKERRRWEAKKKKKFFSALSIQKNDNVKFGMEGRSYMDYIKHEIYNFKSYILYDKMII